MDLPNWILIDKSIEELGVDPRTLTHGSSKKVWRECSLCHVQYFQEFRVARKFKKCKKCFRHNTEDKNLKQCADCKGIFPLSSFNKRKKNNKEKEGLNLFHICKDCHRNMNKEKRPLMHALRRTIRKDFQNFKKEYFSKNPCIDCGESNFIVLTFDHIENLGEKQFNIGNLIGFSDDYAKFINEIQKCVVRCVNCHMAIEKLRIKSRIYCFINNIEFPEKEYFDVKLNKLI